MGPEELKFDPNPTPPENPAPTLVQGGPDTTPPQESAVAAWIHRVTLVVYVMVCIELGLFLAVVPWLPIWTNNSIVIGYPALRSFIGQNFIRGMVTGIGLLDIWLGIWEAVSYKETRRSATTS